MSEETPAATAAELPEALPAAPPGWLEATIAKLRGVALALGSADSPMEVMRLAALQGREALGFNRIGIWLFEEGYRSLTGTYGVDSQGALVDERHCRVFDHGSIPPQRAAWEKPPYYFVKTDDSLRDSEGRIISKGIHITAPLLHLGELLGYVSVDDLLDSSAINDRAGPALGLFADLVATHYAAKLAEARATAAEVSSARSDALKREFLGMLSHEVRTPLNAILGFAQLLCLECDSPNQAKLARTIEQSGDHLLNLLNSIMDYADLTGDDVLRRYAACYPAQIAQETVESFSEVASRKGLSVEFLHEGGEVGAALADAVGLRQIFGNLVQNAIKFTKRGGIRMVVQSQAKGASSLSYYISVEDTGCGIDTERLPLIFKPFSQLDSSFTRSHGGIGMGLAIVERLVAAMGGRIDCESQVGQGSRFNLHFVFQQVEAPSRPRAPTVEVAPPLAAGSASRRILIAEDDPNNRILAQSIAERIDCERIDTAADGEEARQLIAERPYDLLVLDLQMPRLDGLALTRLVRERGCGPINADAPIIGLTAYSSEFDRERCMTAGMNAFFVKPIKAQTLQEIMRRLAYSQR